MLFNGVDIYCSFEGLELESGYIAFDVNIKPTYIDSTLIGSKYTILSLYSGAITLYIGELSGSSASLILKRTTTRGTKYTLKNLPVSTLINKSVDVGFMYSKDGYTFSINGEVVASESNPMPALVFTTGAPCYVGGYPLNGKINDSFYGYINIVKVDSVQYTTVDDVEVEERVPLARLNMSTPIVADSRGIGIPFDIPSNTWLYVHGIAASMSAIFPIDRDVLKDPIKYENGNLTYPIIRDVVAKLQGYQYTFGIDRRLILNNINQFGISRITYKGIKCKSDICRLVVTRSGIRTLELVNGSFTTGGLDGTLLSIDTGLNPAMAENTRPRFEFSNPIRLGVRCISNHVARNGVTIESDGPSKGKWQLAPDVNGKPGTFGGDGVPLILKAVIDDSNFPFWARFRTDFNRKLYDDTTNFRVTGSVEYLV